MHSDPTRTRHGNDNDVNSASVDIDPAGRVWRSSRGIPRQVPHPLGPAQRLLIVLVVVGYLTDQCKNKQWPFLGGLAALAAATGMFALGKTLLLLGIARALQGVSAAFVWVSGMTYLTARLGSARTASALGWSALGQSLGEISGPMVGGSVYDHLGHFACFGVAAGLVLVDLALRLLMLEPPKSAREAMESPQETAPLLRSDHLGPLESTQHALQEDRLTSRRSGFGVILVLLKDMDFLASLWQSCVVALIRTGLESTLPLFVMREFVWSVTGSGLIVFSLVGPSVAGPWIAWMAIKYGPRWPSTLAFLILTAATTGLSFMTGNGTSVEIGFAILCTVVGASLYVPWVSYYTAVCRAAEKYGTPSAEEGEPREPTGQAYAMINLSIAIGMVMGPLWAAWIESTFGWQGINLSFAAASLGSSAISMATYRRWQLDSPTPEPN